MAGDLNQMAALCEWMDYWHVADGSTQIVGMALNARDAVKDESQENRRNIMTVSGPMRQPRPLEWQRCAPRFSLPRAEFKRLLQNYALRSQTQAVR